jgi:precorrin-3B C17-methyltransferase
MVVGLGPGPDRWLTAEASTLLAEATDIVGYAPYVDRVAPSLVSSLARRHASDNREELERARHALTLAEGGARVALVSGGDPGIFAMAAAVFEALETGPSSWRVLDIVIAPGVTAMLAAAARIGAPLGHDFCAISLSDNLKPWALIEKRLALAAQADFVIALYNPASRARPDQIGRAFALLKRGGERVVILAKAVGRADEEILVTSLSEVHPGAVDMRTLVLVGSSTTRIVPRAGGGAWVYTPRGAQDAQP